MGNQSITAVTRIIKKLNAYVKYTQTHTYINEMYNKLPAKCLE